MTSFVTISEIIGTWFAELSSDTHTTCIFRFTDDLRYVSFAENVDIHLNRKWVPMELWGNLESEFCIRLKPRRDHEGWTRRITFEDDKLIIEKTDPPHIKWICKKLNSSDIPAWFEQEVAKSLSRPWK